MNGGVLFLDLGRRLGWAEGQIGEKCVSGMERLASDDGSQAEVFAGLMKFLGTRLTAFRYQALVYEAPLNMLRMPGRTNFATARMTLGLAGIVEGLAHRTGHYRLHEVSLSDVRKSLLGFIPNVKNTRPESVKAAKELGYKISPRDPAKAEVILGVRALGYEPADDNAADAIAGWEHSCSILNKRAEQPAEKMFFD